MINRNVNSNRGHGSSTNSVSSGNHGSMMIGGNKMKKGKISLTVLVMLMVSNGISFFAGAFIALHLGMSNCSSASASASSKESSKSLRKLETQPEEKPQSDSKGKFFSSMFPPETQKFAYGMIHTPKDDFVSHFDMGVPIDLPQKGYEDVLIIYNNKKAMPPKLQAHPPDGITPLDTQSAIENCDYLNIILTNHDAGRQQCVALVPQYESYHIQKWMRVPKTGTSGRKLDHKYNLEPVSRGHQSNGKEQFAPPLAKHTQQHWDMLRTYLASIDDVLADLKPIVEKIKRKNTVIVMVCNFGQSELLINFACSARARGLSTENVIVFATDQETKDLAEGVGLAAYFDQRNFGDIPMGAADHYGDKKFVAMMMAKVICVQVIGLLGVDILFQDVDIVWYRDPLEYFHDEKSPIHEFDAYFQDDGAHSVRYAPWSSNSGFYYLRNNERVQYFLNSLLMSGDLVLKTDSHQQALVAVMSEHASLYGLRVKVLSRDEDEFPGGYHYHQKTGKYMRAMFEGEKKPYIFHMSWTKNKDNKLLFLKQLGQWYVQEKCIATEPSKIKHDDSGLVNACCSPKELFSCHYRDKPSVKPCKKSPPIDSGGKSFW